MTFTVGALPDIYGYRAYDSLGGAQVVVVHDRDTGAVRHVASTSAEDAVRDAGIVVAATNSATPVLQTDWLRDDVHVNLLGPKAEGAAEYPADLVAGASLVTTDSLAQLRDYGPAAAELDRAVELGRFLAEGMQRPEGRSVFHSVGLAGTEVALLAAIGDR